jgi:prephenate dehydrogenase
VTSPKVTTRTGVIGLGLIGGSIALALRGKHEVIGSDADPRAREAARSRGLRVVDSVEDLLRERPHVLVVATPLAAVVPTLERVVPGAGQAIVVEVGSLGVRDDVGLERAPREARIVGLHPMAGSTASGAAAADPSLFSGRPFLVVPTARSDEQVMAFAGDLARDLGGVPTVCSAEWHDRAVAMLSAVPLAVAIALARAGTDVAHLAGPGFEGATRLAATSPELARALLGGSHVKDALARFRAALDEVERGL